MFKLKLKFISYIVKDVSLKLLDQKVTIDSKCEVFKDNSFLRLISRYQDMEIESAYNYLMQQQQYTLYCASNSESFNILLQYHQFYLDSLPQLGF
jgi:hypothetical protein